MVYIKDWIENGFLKRIEDGKVTIYNEISLQHELGIYLREKLKEVNGGYEVQFERNIGFFNIDKDKTVKREIDIVVFNGKEKYAIELKYPRNKQYPEQMYHFVEDIRFMEQLEKEGFNSTYCLTLVDDKLFYTKSTGEKDIYKYFRESADNPVKGKIEKPTGKDNENKFITLDKEYNIDWKEWKELDGYKTYDDYRASKESKGCNEDNPRRYYILEL